VFFKGCKWWRQAGFYKQKVKVDRLNYLARMCHFSFGACAILLLPWLLLGATHFGASVHASCQYFIVSVVQPFICLFAINRDMGVFSPLSYFLFWKLKRPASVDGGSTLYLLI